MLHWLLSTDPNWSKYVSYKTDKFAEHQVKTTCPVDTIWSGLWKCKLTNLMSTPEQSHPITRTDDLNDCKPAAKLLQSQRDIAAESLLQLQPQTDCFSDSSPLFSSDSEQNDIEIPPMPSTKNVQLPSTQPKVANEPDQEDCTIKFVVAQTETPFGAINERTIEGVAPTDAVPVKVVVAQTKTPYGVTNERTIEGVAPTDAVPTNVPICLPVSV